MHFLVPYINKLNGNVRSWISLELVRFGEMQPFLILAQLININIFRDRKGNMI